MPLWTKVSPPKWVPNAVQTNRGWTDPSTGEVYVTIGSLVDIASAKVTRIRVDKVAYHFGEVVNAYVYFTEPVTVTGTPQLTLVFTAQSRTANYSSGTGTNRLTFQYTTQVGDTTAVGALTATSPLSLNSGTITDTNGASPLSATLTFASTAYTRQDSGTTPGQTLAGYALPLVSLDVTKPTLGSAAIASSAHTTFPITGDIITLTLTASEAVTVTGLPQVAFVINGTTRQLVYSSATSTSTSLKFKYTIVGGDVSAVAGNVTVGTLSLNSGTIKDAALNTATLTFAAPDTSAWVVNDTTAPTVGSAALASNAHGTHPVTGDVLTLTLTASEPVIFTGSPQVALVVNLTTRQLVYNSGASTSTSLKFTYTVVGGDVATSSQLSVGTLSLNSGTIKDGSGNNATLTFAAPDVSAWAVN